MRYRIVHTTVYHYSQPASLSQNELFLTPRQTPNQQLISSRLKVEPQPQYMHQRYDYFGNDAQVFMVQHPHQELHICATSVIQTSAPFFVAPEKTIGWEEAAERLRHHGNRQELDGYQFVFASPLVGLSGAVTEYGRQSFPANIPLLAGVLDLVRRIYTDFQYKKNTTTVDTTIDKVLVSRKGVCQDFAHLAIGCLRGLGLAARYVSGYIETLPPPGGQKMVGADASHAWLAVYVPDVGWVDVDPTNNMVCGERHVTLGWGRDYGDVTPVKGVVMGGGRHQLTVTVDVVAEQETGAPVPNGAVSAAPIGGNGQAV